MPDDYSNHPISIAEAKATKNHDAGLWSPRDALIAALRDIDSGVYKPNHCLVILATVDPDGTEQTYYRSIPSTFYGVGMLSAAINDTFKRDQI